MSRTDPHLRRHLRAGDPAAGAPRPSPGEMERLRSSVLEAASQGRRQRAFSWWLPVPVALALVALGVAWLGLGTGSRGPGEATQRTAVEPPPPTQREVGSTGVEAAPEEVVTTPPDPKPTGLLEIPEELPTRVATADPEPPEGRRGEAHPEVAVAGPRETSGSAPDAALPAPGHRRLDLTAPGGTRLVWVLTEDPAVALEIDIATLQGDRS
jgi:hypothetical protein